MRTSREVLLHSVGCNIQRWLRPAIKRGIALAAMSAGTVPVFAQSSNSLATTPPIGWNSWDAYGTTITESETKANADAMAKSLKAYGWQYIVVDIQWYEPNPKAHGYRTDSTFAMDDYGRLIPAPNRFPSAKNGLGFKALADYVHSKGLKFGIHILRGIPRQAVERNTPVLGTDLRAADIADRSSTCHWNGDMFGVDVSKPGGQAYYDSIVAQYAAWGVDFIKADDMTRPYHAPEIAALHRAIQKSGRPIVLSLSPGPAPLDQVDDLRRNAQMWRVEDDLWDDWKAIRKVYDHAEQWAPYAGDGHWPDYDMLPLGHIGIRAERGQDRLSRLTHDEQRTVMTMWSMVHSPLIFGGDLSTLDPFTRSLLTNPSVIDVDQRSAHSRLIHHDSELDVWEADKPDTDDHYLALINLSDRSRKIRGPWTDFGVNAAPVNVIDLWTGKERPWLSQIDAELEAHASLLISIKGKK